MARLHLMPTDTPDAVAADTLAERIARGRPGKPAITVREALTISRQIADALETAHAKGIVHRDLKPANITVTPAGTVTVLAFGSAKATAASDKRTDIWAFGCVLYEMLTGRGAFGDDAPSATATLDRAPDWRALPDATPSAIRRLIQRCLDADPSRRLHDIADARIEIDDALASPAAETIAVLAAPSRRVALRAIAALAGVTVIALVAWAYTRPSPRAPEPPSRFTMSLPPSPPLNLYGTDRSLALSPDGRHLVYRAGGTFTFGSPLMLREIDQLEARPLAGTSGALGPFFSPDSQWIGFFEVREGPDSRDQGPELKKVSIGGGPALTICRIVGMPLGASWGDDNTIVFATDVTGIGLWRVPASGGEPTVLTKLDTSQVETYHIFPSVLPGSRGVLFTNIAKNEPQVAILDRKTGQRKTLVRGASDAEYVEPGHLIYAADDTLRVLGFDPVRREVLGDPVTAAEAVMMTRFGAAAQYAVSRSGTLIYAPGGTGAQQSLVWVDRKGREEPLNAPAGAYVVPRLSPDGTRVVVTSWESDADLWMWDLVRDRGTRLTSNYANDMAPVWTPDSRRVVFASARDRTSVYNLYSVAADGLGEERLTTSPYWHLPSSITPDGTRILGHGQGTPGGLDLLTIPVMPPSKEETVFHTPFDEVFPEVSPNGRYLAYVSDEPGTRDVYVRPFPHVDRGVWKVSREGGTRAVWARNGRELFYLDGLKTLMAVPVDTSGPTFNAGAPARLFDAARYSSWYPTRNYDVSPDGQRFLMIKDGPPAQLIVVERWLEALKARVSPGR